MINKVKPKIKLNEFQKKYAQKVYNKLLSGKYTTTQKHCPLCIKKNDKLIRKIDRYGFPVQTVICKNCGLVRLNPQPTQKTYNEYYDNEYRALLEGKKSADEDFFKIQYQQGELIFEFIQKQLFKEIKNLFIVEIGPGAGGILKFFKDKQNNTLGFDLGTEYIKFGKEKGLKLEFGTIDSLKKLKTKPNIIIYSHVLEHTIDPLKELKKAKKYLASDGVIYIEVPGIYSILEQFNGTFDEYIHIGHPFSFTLKTLENVASKAGLELIKGTEYVKALYKNKKNTKKITNQYKNIHSFIEQLPNKTPLNIKIKQTIQNILIQISKITGLFSAGKKIYFKIKK